jgi:MYXO-CTERM domain-containing protein
MRSRMAGGLAAVATVVMLAPAAQANDDSSHLWVTEKALDSLPPGCQITQFMKDADLRSMIDNGTIFPDLGYVPQQSAEASAAGEASHWEPFYDAYAAYIRNMPGFPGDALPRQVLAHYMGLVSHNMSDELYDSMYIERVDRYDAQDLTDVDELLGYALIEGAGARTPPSSWIPMDQVLAVFNGLGYSPDAASIQYGVTTVALSITGMNAAYLFKIGQAKSMFPWGTAHLFDPAAYGSPAGYAPAIARWWQVRWAIAHGRPPPSPVLQTWPRDTAVHHEVKASSIESWVNIAMAREVEAASIQSQIRVKDSQDNVLPVDIGVYYAHIVQLRPKQDLAPDEVYTLELDPGIQDATGQSLAGYRFRFSTGDTAPPPTVNPTFWDQCVGEMDDPPDVILPDGWDAGTDTDADAQGNDAAVGDATAESDAAKDDASPPGKDAAPAMDAAKYAEAGAEASGEVPAAPASDGGCSCRTQQGTRNSGGVAALAALAFALRARR